MIHKIHTLDQENIQLIEGRAMQETLADFFPSKKTTEPAIDSENSIDLPSGQTIGLTDCLFFDIETTGLSAETSFIFLIGCIGCEDGVWKMHQFFIRMVQEEKAMLSTFFELSQQYLALVHFNGNTFDLPFIRKRAAVYGLKAITDSLLSIDLYRHFSPLRKILALPHMNQSFLEKYVGWDRKDQMSGKEVVSLFWNYSVSKSEEEERLLLLHNHDDLLGMLHVPAMEAYFSLFSGEIRPAVTAEESKDHDALLVQFEPELPLPSHLETTFSISEDSETILSAKKPCPHDTETGANSPILLQAGSTSGLLRIPLYCGTLRYFFPDYRNYYYLPLEKQAIHKSVAAYVAKEYRVPASPQNCYVEKTGRFLPLPPPATHNAGEASILKQPPFSPALRENFESKTNYFEYVGLDSFKNRENYSLLPDYVRMLLRSVH